MILVSPVVFWILVVIGLLCALGTIATALWYKKINNPTPKQDKTHAVLFRVFFMGFLILGFTPIFLTLLIM